MSQPIRILFKNPNRQFPSVQRSFEIIDILILNYNFLKSLKKNLLFYTQHMNELSNFKSWYISFRIEQIDSKWRLRIHAN